MIALIVVMCLMGVALFGLVMFILGGCAPLLRLIKGMSGRDPDGYSAVSSEPPPYDW